MVARVYSVLFLCTGNSARSILAEGMLGGLGRGRFKAYSAGSHPSGLVNPFALEVLERMHLPTAGARSKAWDEFAAPGAPIMDFVFTVCDNAAGEVCPVWPGRPLTAHWGVKDPAEATGADEEKRKVFAAVANQLRSRIQVFVDLPMESIDRLVLQQKLTAIGKT